MRPVNALASETGRSSTWATVTSGAGLAAAGSAAWDGEPPAPSQSAEAIATASADEPNRSFFFMTMSRELERGKAESRAAAQDATSTLVEIKSDRLRGRNLGLARQAKNGSTITS